MATKARERYTPTSTQPHTVSPQPRHSFASALVSAAATSDKPVELRPSHFLID